ncbi:Beta-1,3-galactosyltransferase 4 [Phytophthora pseudosyringae]|uniref:Hexosyltransferase n=1 Tax=Phytophthora pseudosyringae TaxID=221518 RepID=A0A8T1VGZ0_9STRA|nr:Beta-1,3-galactosyltransferase 4 [Phytophthora pseudosyringae]
MRMLRTLVALAALLTAVSRGVLFTRDDDQITHFQIQHPPDGDVVALPLRFRFNMVVRSPDAFKAQYGARLLCLELVGVTTKCSSLMGARIRFKELPEGKHVARAYILGGDHHTRYHETEPRSFSILSAADFEAHVEQLSEQTRKTQGFPPDLDILQWAELQAKERSTSPKSAADTANGSAKPTDVMLIIGVKSAVVGNFARRQAIRGTWASEAAMPSNVKVFFAGCTPSLDNIVNERDPQHLQAAVNLERAVYGDLLTQELKCEDSRLLLAEKVSAFCEWVVAELPQTKFVLLTDDDVYVRVLDLVRDLLTSVQRGKLYLGELMNEMHPLALTPVRIPSDAYYTSKQSYPLKQFVPYAAGPHILLSMDCVQFIAKNRRRLASLDGHDDTSIALWLLSIQVHVQSTAVLTGIRFLPCKDSALSMADLSPLGIRSIHHNLLHNRTVCHGFSLPLWEWRPSGGQTSSSVIA